MKAQYINLNVRAPCPDCGGSITTFEHKHDNRELGHVIIDAPHSFEKKNYTRTIYYLLQCAGCGRAGLVKIHDNGKSREGVLDSFYPVSIESAKIPENVPDEITSEYREAELCASFEAWRAASALFRSTLEKILKANGYLKGNLVQKIDGAAGDGIITESRRKRAHEDIRVLGNDVLHDKWREVDEIEVKLSHHYTQRIIEDFYDDRDSVEAILIEKGRINKENGKEKA
jgi:hypothetical protein